ncbi:hypothetical protein CO669_00635 [Bradyrhizobium sp. Y36]|nr:hypothetical protein CO669_00635 [Bradyrhizobium sp. Y36]
MGINLQNDTARKTAGILAFFGLILLASCVLIVAFETHFDRWLYESKSAAGVVVSSAKDARDDCGPKLEQDLKQPDGASEQATADKEGKLRIIAVWPPTVRLDGHICVVAAGIASQASLDKLKAAVDVKDKEVVAAQTAFDNAPADKKADFEKKLASAKLALAEAKAARDQPASVEGVALFLNGSRSPLALGALATPAPQLLSYKFGQNPDASSEDAKFWRKLLGGKTDQGVASFRIGLSRSQGSTPEIERKEAIKFRVFWPPVVGLGALSVVLLALAFAIFAANSSILRDHALSNIETAEYNDRIARAAAAADPANQALADKSAQTAQVLLACKNASTKDDPGGCYSLGRTQMALWLWLSIAGFIFVWLTLGIYRNVITEAILVLLGINSVTGLAAVILDKDDPKKPMEKETTKGFWADLMSDGEGPKLHRIQMIGWTGILAIIFAWNVVANFIFVEFDAYLLMLMGIVNSAYLGFKTQEKVPAK